MHEEHLVERACEASRALFDNHSLESARDTSRASPCSRMHAREECGCAACT
jgi:hypothetical protein